MQPFILLLISNFDEFGRNSQYNNATFRMIVRKAGGGIYVLVTRKAGQEKSDLRLKNKSSPQTLNLLRFEQVKSVGFIFHGVDRFFTPRFRIVPCT